MSSVCFCAPVHPVAGAGLLRSSTGVASGGRWGVSRITAPAPAPSHASVSFKRARVASMTLAESDSAEDEAPSDTYVPAGDSGEELEKLSARLLRLCATTSRGQACAGGESDKAAVDSAASALEAVSPEPEPVNSELFDGVWLLAYCSAPLYQTSPLLLGAGTPLAEVGAVKQKVDLASGRITTDVEVVAFPYTTLTLRTVCSAVPTGADRVELVVEKSTVVGGKLAGRFDMGGLSLDVPVAALYERLRRAVPETFFDTYFLSPSMRISRSKSGTLYVYVKIDG